ncbi:Ff.00g038330.m01.CDS01 [Fusarium sp. VM40]|nr:Ff.00g038330.m01.CDS01 [Fusarium sp. VM40]
MSASPPRAKRLMDTITEAHRMSYRIGRGEQGVLTFEPYKSAILPLWRFRTVPIAQKSAEDLWEKFKEFKDQNDFVGMDMTRKFIQMGMTRAKRYANHAGGRKYKKGTKEELPQSDEHPDKDEKERASMIFRGYWTRCKEDEGYQDLKKDFLKQQKDWK